MEHTINDIVREAEEQGSDSQWTPETVTVCDCCGSENVHTAGDGNMGFCEDCDAPCSTSEIVDSDVADVGDSVRCCMCGDIICINEHTLGLVSSGGHANWYCDMCE